MFSNYRQPGPAVLDGGVHISVLRQFLFCQLPSTFPARSHIEAFLTQSYDPDQFCGGLRAASGGGMRSRRCETDAVPSDAMLQEEARQITSGPKDPWGQTISENNNWLAALRSQHVGDVRQAVDMGFGAV
ncbi:hypothetical protein BKA67DRAFT_12379 [Truncatella angustata]|uniref:Uncharacterized protein n=1 Tax=Truncatella angustata TaxID=152316 RepID=A0A9P8UWN0_9PEZI|nr:uncharacterized protein BKA67DRAFT_12379 [Truncatella angustata]KAH6659376.1 hypothetical protein BKA67DRAFT_12379 [Truncatella angustata]KAH8205614.1 hypothetical protein TruAng_000320 [Truncatella angustata]